MDVERMCDRLESMDQRLESLQKIAKQKSNDQTESEELDRVIEALKEHIKLTKQNSDAQYQFNKDFLALMRGVFEILGKLNWRNS